ncbi:Gp49 family protein [Pseudomonas fluorescens]|uniref:Gp49 family protein n=1 Tax=Pseudomonas fluorescens TaxID=294 RepID=UPI0005FB86C7|nr:Gp49 family protein [Pseudomonas fluorescens]KJZ41321.1 phage family protein [Pseudomonas fluorescens]
MTDQAIEQEIQAKGLTAPRITPADLQANISGEFYFTAKDGLRGEFAASGFGLVEDEESAPLDLLTFCVLILKNGFTVTGESACASPENFDAEIGRKIARQNAEQKIWPLMGYELKERLSRGEA